MFKVDVTPLARVFLPVPVAFSFPVLAFRNQNLQWEVWMRVDVCEKFGHLLSSTPIWHVRSRCLLFEALHTEPECAVEELAVNSAAGVQQPRFRYTLITYASIVFRS